MKPEIAGYKVKKWLLNDDYFSLPENVALLEQLAEKLSVSGMRNLVKCFFDQAECDRAADHLFEMWFGGGLLQQDGICDLEYEPKPEQPDFRFSFQGVEFNLQVKRVLNIVAEADKRNFIRTIDEEPPLAKPWVINITLSPCFHRKYFKEFREYLKANANTFQPRRQSEIQLAGDYVWKKDGVPLVKYSFMERNPEERFALGMVFYDNSGVIDDARHKPARKSIAAKLKDASKTLKNLAPDSCSMVVLQPVSDLFLKHCDMLDIFYGTESIKNFLEKETGRRVPCRIRGDRGIFKPKANSRIAGVLVVDGRIDYLRSPFNGMFYPHLRHIELLKKYILPFEGWKYVTTDECSKSPIPLPIN
ncbi:hypothetical protein CVU37_03775 [candidate division BRC1 bacterium HGW-BRC1-1]|jgi:hypothetical protein|nr:MAG: hypothetical protein CVU37_03775 [candidate division BRC1 bacterium HGW-BRC1-1]